MLSRVTRGIVSCLALLKTPNRRARDGDGGVGIRTGTGTGTITVTVTVTPYYTSIDPISASRSAAIPA